MRAIVAERFGGYQDLKLADILEPTVSNGRILVRITAAGVTPLDHTILSGGHPRAKAPLVLGNEGAGVVEASGDDRFRKVPGLCSRGHTVSPRMARSVN